MSAPIDPRRVADNVARLRSHIVSRTDRAVRLVAVTKSFGADAIEAAVAAGCTDIGENYAQELLEKLPLVRGPRPTVHFIGQLQSNKVRRLAEVVDLWQTVDRSSLVGQLARHRPGAAVLVQVDATDEPGKGGCRPADLAGLVDECRRSGLLVRGLMTVGPTDGDPVRTRRAFALVARLAAEHDLHELSMGMSGDLDVALEEGATMVRIGSAIFGDRPPAG